MIAINLLNSNIKTFCGYFTRVYDPVYKVMLSQYSEMLSLSYTKIYVHYRKYTNIYIRAGFFFLIWLMCLANLLPDNYWGVVVYFNSNYCKVVIYFNI